MSEKLFDIILFCLMLTFLNSMDILEFWTKGSLMLIADAECIEGSVRNAKMVKTKTKALEEQVVTISVLSNSTNHLHTSLMADLRQEIKRVS